MSQYSEFISMSAFIVYLLIAVFVLISCVSIFYIIRHQRIIAEAKKQELLQQEKTEQRYREKRAYLIESVKVISQAVENDEKLTNAEASLRLTPLLEALAPHLLDQADFSVIREFHKRVEHVPIKEDWKKLSKQERWKFMREMNAADAELGGAFKEAASLLVKHDFNLMHWEWIFS